MTSYIAELAASGSSMDRAQIDALRALYGLDQPMYVQYFKWIGRLLVGDLGVSLDWQRPISQLICSASCRSLARVVVVNVVRPGSALASGSRNIAWA